MKNKFLLPLDLQFFAADTGGETGGVSTEGEGGQTSDGKENTEQTDTQSQESHMIPKCRFDEVNEGYKTVKQELDAIKAANAKAEKERQAKEQEEAEKKGEFEGLYNKTKTDFETLKSQATKSSERIESLEGVIQGLLDSKLQSIDEDYHDLIPDGMTPEQKLAWVTNAESKGLFGKRETNTPLGEQTNPKGKGEVDVSKLSPMQLMLSGYSN